MLSWHLLVCFLKWIWKIQFPAAFWRIKLHRQFLNVETVKSCSFLLINSRNGGCRTLGITSVSMALCLHIMRGEALGLHVPNTGAPWDWEEDVVLQLIWDGGPQLAASSFLPWWHALKLWKQNSHRGFRVESDFDVKKGRMWLCCDPELGSRGAAGGQRCLHRVNFHGAPRNHVCSDPLGQKKTTWMLHQSLPEGLQCFPLWKAASSSEKQHLA